VRLSEELDPMRAKVKAATLLKIWRERGASTARLLNQRDNENYVLKQ
jgi:hypothetical protein